MLFVSRSHSRGGECGYACFNLGIEMLFVSRTAVASRRFNLPTGLFQSRNRDAFRFKGTMTVSIAEDAVSFNLGIEMLFVSRT